MTQDLNTPASAEETFEALGEIAAVAPEQTGEYPKWEYRDRQNPKWGTVEREGLIVGRGSRRQVVPPDEVYKLAVLGCSNRDIAEWFNISEDTLHYNFAIFLKKARIDLKQKLRRAMLQNAMVNNSAAVQIFLAKNMLGMSDNPQVAEGQQPLPWNEIGDEDTDQE